MDIRKSKVDILMATYNGEKYIKQQLDSLMNQTFTDFNIIIADDKSTDTTLDIMLDYQKKDPRISIVQNEENIGVIKNFEKLITLSSADYFMLCDQDDVWLEDKVAKSVNAIIETNAMLAFTDLQLVDQNLNVINKSFLNYQGIKEIKNINWKTLLVQNIVTGCTIIADKDIKRCSLPFPSNIPMHDAWLALVAAVYGEVHYINEALILYRQHDSNVIGGVNSNARISRVDGEYYQFLKERETKFGNNIQLLEGYINYGFGNQRIDKDLAYVITYYNKFTKIKWIKLGFIGVKFKVLFPSVGIKRNVWWVLYLQYPFLSYMIISFKKLLSYNKKKI